MRTVVKGAAGNDDLAREHRRPPGNAREATVRWQRFRRCKPRLLVQLLEEQHQLCCYSEVRPHQLGLGCHIEHVVPKHEAPNRTFDYANLAASALDSDDLQMLKADTFGGHAKQHQFDAVLFISCHERGSARFFAYLSDGRVVPSLALDNHEHARARYTIDVLNLNSPFLVALRRAWWNELEDLYAEHEKKGWSLEHLLAVDILPGANGLSPFFSLTRQFFGELADHVLREHAPSLL